MPAFQHDLAHTTESTHWRHADMARYYAEQSASSAQASASSLDEVRRIAQRIDPTILEAAIQEGVRTLQNATGEAVASSEVAISNYAQSVLPELYQQLNNKYLECSGLLYNDYTQYSTALSEQIETLYSRLAPVATSGSYNDLTDKPYIPVLTDFADVATSGDYNDLINTPVLFSGSYNDLTDKPELFSGSYEDLTDKPELFSGSYEDLTDRPELFSGSYEDLTDKPELFSGDYNDLNNKPQLFSGDYNDLINTPYIPYFHLAPLRGGAASTDALVLSYVSWGMPTIYLVQLVAVTASTGAYNANGSYFINITRNDNTGAYQINSTALGTAGTARWTGTSDTANGTYTYTVPNATYTVYAYWYRVAPI